MSKPGESFPQRRQLRRLNIYSRPALLRVEKRDREHDSTASVLKLAYVPEGVGKVGRFFRGQADRRVSADAYGDAMRHAGTIRKPKVGGRRGRAPS